MSHGAIKKICRLPSCRKEFITTRQWQEFCKPDHQKEYQKLLRRSHDEVIVEMELLKERIRKIEKKLEEANLRIPQMIKDFIIFGNKK